MAEEDAKVVRHIKARSTKKPDSKDEKSAKKRPVKAKKTAAKSTKTSKKTPKNKAKSDAEVGYFRGAWRELRQVHWPNRRATWKLTVAVIVFSGFFMALILLCDWLFEWIIKGVVL